MTTGVSLPARAIFALTLALLGCVAVYGVNLYLAGVRSYTDWLNYRMVTQVNSPVIAALLDGTVTYGTPRTQVTLIEKPVWTESLGRYVVYGYAMGYDSRTLVFVDDRLVSAAAGSCTWRWEFFDHAPKEVVNAAHAYYAIQDAVRLTPETAPYLQGEFDRCTTLLRIPPLDLRDLAKP